MKLLRIAFICCFVLAGVIFFFIDKPQNESQPLNHKKIYWLIPDGLRSDGYLIDLEKMASRGLLPNFKRLLESSTYIKSRPEYPGHSAVNFASIVTGSVPSTHGVTDNFIGSLKERLDGSAQWGFDYSSLKVEPFWQAIGERALLAFMPHAPVLGAEARWLGERFSSVLGRKRSFWIHFDEKDSLLKKCSLEPVHCSGTLYFALRNQTPALRYEADTPLGSIALTPTENGAILVWQEEKLEIKKGELSAWFPSLGAAFYLEQISPSSLRLRIILSQLKGHDPALMKIEELRPVLNAPFLDYPGNNPVSLEFTPEDDEVFMAETQLAATSHSKLGATLAPLLGRDFDLIMHSMYFPNMALTRKWQQHPSALTQLSEPVVATYQAVDQVVGSILDHLPDDALLVVSSDHGISAMKAEVSLNEWLRQQGFLTLKNKKMRSKEDIDWSKTAAVFLSTSSLFLTENATAAVVTNLKHKLLELEYQGDKVIKDILSPRPGELQVMVAAGYHLNEDIEDEMIFSSPKKLGGFKEALAPNLPELETAMIIYQKGRPALREERVLSSHEQLSFLQQFLSKEEGTP